MEDQSLLVLFCVHKSSIFTRSSTRLVLSSTDVSVPEITVPSDQFIDN